MVYAGVAGEERWIGECLRRMGLLRVVEGRCEGDGIGFMGHDEEWGGDEDGGDELASMLWRVHCQAKEVRRARARERWKRGRGESQGKRRVGERRVELGIWRSDYMVSTGSDIREGRGDREAGDASALELKQVEFNTIAWYVGLLSFNHSYRRLLHLRIGGDEHPDLRPLDHFSSIGRRGMGRQN